MACGKYFEKNGLHNEHICEECEKCILFDIDILCKDCNRRNTGIVCNFKKG